MWRGLCVCAYVWLLSDTLIFSNFFHFNLMWSKVNLCVWGKGWRRPVFFFLLLHNFNFHLNFSFLFCCCHFQIWWTALSVALGLNVRGDVIRGAPCIKRNHQLFCPQAGSQYPKYVSHTHPFKISDDDTTHKSFLCYAMHLKVNTDLNYSYATNNLFLRKN